MEQLQTMGISKPILSGQRFVHPRLAHQVAKHLAEPARRPPAEHTLRAFESLTPMVESHSGPLILDSFCGTGLSTAKLAERFPDALVVGVDKSALRLQKHQPGARENYQLIQAECGDFWRLCLTAGWPIDRHFMLYPNPWPKPGHLQRRVHGSADFSAFLQLGGHTEIRSNWQTYIEEMGVALNLAGYVPIVDKIEPENPITLFERKYLQSGHPLWRCRANLSHNTAH